MVLSALSAAQLNVQQGDTADQYEIVLSVWNHSYDHPVPSYRSSLISKVRLVNLPIVEGKKLALKLHSITDRDGVDTRPLWTGESSGRDRGWSGYRELDVGARGGFSVKWGGFVGVYDERCLGDPSIDAHRFRNHINVLSSTEQQPAFYTYLIGPVRFAFSLNTWNEDIGVELTHSHIGGNGGDPAVRYGGGETQVHRVFFGR